jgi:mitogen-activated protein kinase kinase kinase
MAPESIKKQEYSTKSDVWAYGCLVIEIYNRGDVYPGMTLLSIATQVCSGDLTPNIPKHLPQSLHDMLRRCWSMDPVQRPAMQEIVEIVDKAYH